MYGFQMESGVVAEFGGFSPLKSGGGAEGKRTFHSRERGNLYASLCDANYRRFATQTDSRVRGNGMRGGGIPQLPASISFFHKKTA